MTTAQKLLDVECLSMMYGERVGCQDVSFTLYPGEVLGIVGESGSGKSTLLRAISGQVEPTAGRVVYNTQDQGIRDLFADLSEAERRFLMRTDWAFVHQNPRDGLRMGVSAGANIGERLMAVGWRHYGKIRAADDRQDHVLDQYRTFLCTIENKGNKYPLVASHNAQSNILPRIIIRSVLLMISVCFMRNDLEDFIRE